MIFSLLVRGRAGSVRRGQVRSSRAKGKSGQNAGSVNGSAEDPRTRELGRKISGHVGCVRAGAEEIRPASPTEDAARRRLAAARTVPGPTDRTRATSEEFTGQNGKLDDFGSAVTAQCGKSKKKAHRKRGGTR